MSSYSKAQAYLTCLPLLRLLQRFGRDSSGSVLAYVGIVLPVLLGAAGLGIEVSLWHAQKRGIQTMADAAAMAAVLEMARVQDKDSAIAAAELDATNNGYHVGSGDSIDINNPPESGLFTGSSLAWEVIVSRPVPIILSGLVFDGQLTVRARAVATVGASAPCIIALDAGETKDAFKLNGGSVIADGCSAHVNSTDSIALDVSSNSELQADSIEVVGGYQDPEGNASPTPATGVGQISDPLSHLVPPTVGACDYDGLSISSGSHSFAPGVYCNGVSISSHADITFEPGVHIFEGGKLNASSNVTLRGDGVTFYLADDKAELSIAGADNIDLSAPTSGQYAGVLFYANPNPGKKTKHIISGGATISYEGTIYLPDGELQITGNGDVTANSSPYTMLIAREIKVGGNGYVYFNSDYDSSSVPLPSGLAGNSVGLVE